MSHRRRIKIIISTPTQLSALLEEGIVGIEIAGTANEEDAEEVVIAESSLTTGQRDCLLGLAGEFAD
jgi:hypothetical protein